MKILDYEFLTILPDLLLKVLIATICGAIIGYDREVKQKVAGLRTNILICVGCTIFTASSFFISDSLSNIDPTRIIGQIITGIGFLGAGVIVKNDDKVVGVTTAAFIWVISAIGVLIGSGLFFMPIILSVGLMMISKLFEKVETYIKNNIHK
jgi:putative Mg2+ transporter-C (MgtC) family protein